MRTLIVLVVLAVGCTTTSQDAPGDARTRAEAHPDLAPAADGSITPDALERSRTDGSVLPDLDVRVDLVQPAAPDLDPGCGGDHEPCCTSGAPCGVDSAGRAMTCMVRGANQSGSCADLTATICIAETTGCGSFGTPCCDDNGEALCEAINVTGKPYSCSGGKCAGCY